MNDEISRALLEKYESLVHHSVVARENAYAPYSQFRVGAALVDNAGAIYKGVNVEQSSYGLTICAERSAAVAAIADGATRFEAIAIAAAGGCTPCGACRQFLYEFSPDLLLILVDADQKRCVQIRRLSKLLPDAFRLKGP
jgi:cytidine deaminase